MIFRIGTPNLSEAERTRSSGVVVIYYADENDYRCRWYSELDFFNMPMEGQEPGATATFGDLWSEGEPVTIESEHVRNWYVPRFLDAMRVTREAPDEPPHSGYEVWWQGVLVHQEEVHSA